MTKKKYLCNRNANSHPMGPRLKKLKKIRIHNEGTNTLAICFIGIAAIAALLWFFFDTKIPFIAFLMVFGTLFGIILNFFRCPIRYRGGSRRRQSGSDRGSGRV